MSRKIRQTWGQYDILAINQHGLLLFNTMSTARMPAMLPLAFSFDEHLAYSLAGGPHCLASQGNEAERAWVEHIACNGFCSLLVPLI